MHQVRYRKSNRIVVNYQKASMLFPRQLSDGKFQTQVHHPKHKARAEADAEQTSDAEARVIDVAPVHKSLIGDKKGRETSNSSVQNIRQGRLNCIVRCGRERERKEERHIPAIEPARPTRRAPTDREPKYGHPDDGHDHIEPSELLELPPSEVESEASVDVVDPWVTALRLLSSSTTATTSIVVVVGFRIGGV
jgi:hypothetical protein